MSLDKSLRRLTAMVEELDKAATAIQKEAASPQVDLFAPRKTPADNTLVAKTLDRTIERIENLLSVGSR